MKFSVANHLRRGAPYGMKLRTGCGFGEVHRIQDSKRFGLSIPDIVEVGIELQQSGRQG